MTMPAAAPISVSTFMNLAKQSTTNDPASASVRSAGSTRTADEGDRQERQRGDVHDPGRALAPEGADEHEDERADGENDLRQGRAEERERRGAAVHADLTGAIAAVFTAESADWTWVRSFAGRRVEGVEDRVRLRRRSRSRATTSGREDRDLAAVEVRDRPAGTAW